MHASKPWMVIVVTQSWYVVPSTMVGRVNWCCWMEPSNTNTTWGFSAIICLRESTGDLANLALGHHHCMKFVTDIHELVWSVHIQWQGFILGEHLWKIWPFNFQTNHEGNLSFMTHIQNNFLLWIAIMFFCAWFSISINFSNFNFPTSHIIHAFFTSFGSSFIWLINSVWWQIAISRNIYMR